jgi:hypothetical protein
MSKFQSSSLSLRSRLLGGCALSLVALGACAVGDVPPGQMNGDAPDRIASDVPGIDDRLDGLGIICESTMTVTGTFEPGIAQPAEVLGCWPVGKWTLSATIDRLGCDPQPPFAESYVYNVTYDEELSTVGVTFPGEPPEVCSNGQTCCEDSTDNDGDGLIDDDDPGCRVNLKISTAGDSLCHGAMDHFMLDGTVIGFRPTLQLDGTLQGIGTYTVHPDDTF